RELDAGVQGVAGDLGDLLAGPVHETEPRVVTGGESADAHGPQRMGFRPVGRVADRIWAGECDEGHIARRARAGAGRPTTYPGTSCRSSPSRYGASARRCTPPPSSGCPPTGSPAVSRA